MKINKYSFAAFLTTFIITSTQAGTYFEEETICPIGGEVFKVPATASCSSYGAKTMSFQTITSCEFVDPMPQGPTNKLPLYKEYSQNERAQIEMFMQSETYKQAATHSRFYLAYVMEDQLLQSADISKFQILLTGYWSDFDRALNDEDYQAAFITEFEKELSEAPLESQPTLRAIGAYFNVLFGDAARAEVELAEAREQAKTMEPNPLLESYFSKIEACIQNPDQAQCEPDSPILGDQ